MNDPIPFVLTGEDGKSLSIDPRARAALAKIDKPLVVLSVVGMYRWTIWPWSDMLGVSFQYFITTVVWLKTKHVWVPLVSKFLLQDWQEFPAEPAHEPN